MRKFFWLFAAIPLVFSSCGSSGKDKKNTIKVAYLYSDVNFRSIIRKSTICNAFDIPGYELILRKSMLNKADQIANLQELICTDVDYIIMEPCSETGFEDVLKNARHNRKNIIFAESGISDRFEDLYISRIGPDYFHEGTGMVERLRKIFDRKNMTDTDINFAVIQGMSGVCPHARRYAGIMKGASELDNWNFIIRRTTRFSKDRAFSCTVEILKEHPETNLLFVLSEDDAAPVLSAVNSLGLKAGKDVFIAVFSASTESSSALASGDFVCVSVSDPRFGVEIRNTIEMVENGNHIKKEIFIPSEFFSISESVLFRDKVNY